MASTGKFLILGGTGSIGSALARRLVKKGYEVHIIGRSSSKLQEVGSSLSVATSQADVSDLADLEAAVKAVGPVTGLAYSIGTINIKPLKATKPDDFVQAFMLNAVGAATAVKAALPGLHEQHKASGVPGSVVLFSSVAVQQGFANHSVLSAAKGAVEGLIRALAGELAPKVRVNGVAPSLTETEMSSFMTKSGPLKDAIIKAHPLPRLGSPDDAAAAAAFLLDPAESSWVTGQILGVDGGRSAIAHQ